MTETQPTGAPSNSDTMPPVIVLGRGITALGVIRSLARIGVVAYLVGADDGVVRHSRFYRALPGSQDEPPSVGELEGFLRGLTAQAAVLFPCSDDWVAAIGEIPADLAKRFPSSLAPPAVLRTLIDKGTFALALRSLAIPHPLTHVVASEADLSGLDPALLTGAFWKPRLSHAFLPHFGVKAFRIESPEQGFALWRTAHAAGFDLVLQEYIPGPPTAHYFIDGFMDREGRVRARFARRRLRMDPPDFGNSTYMEVVPVADVAPAAESLDCFLRGIGYRGIFSAEFKHDARDGTFKILEVNSRAWWYVGFATDCGVNVCEMAYRDALGLPVPAVEQYDVGAFCVYPHHDVRSWLHTDRAQRTSLPALVRSWAFARQPVFCWNDPLPALASTWHWLRELLRHGHQG